VIIDAENISIIKIIMKGAFFYMENVLYEASLESSYVYKSFNVSNGVIEKIVKCIKTGVPLDKEYIEEQYFQIKKTVISPLSVRVLEAFDNGLIELLYSKEVKVGVSIPFIVRKGEGGKVIATVFIGSFATLDKDNNLNIPVKQLYGLMESAYIALMMQTNPMKIQRNVGLMKICQDVYVEMMIRILNRDYALTMDKQLYDKCRYCFSKFFLTFVWEYPNKDLIDAYAKSGLDNITPLDLDMLKVAYDGFGVNDLKSLLEFMKGLAPRMADLNVRYFLERFVATYHGSSIISVDYLPYLFFVITNVILSTFLIGQAALSDIIKNTKNIGKFYPELSKLI
jgi:hypothetical protein